MIKKRINIGLDLDGVIVDHTQNKIKIAKSVGFRVEAKETQSEILKSILPEKEYRKVQRIIYDKITSDASPTPFLLKTLQDLSLNYNFFIISLRRKKHSEVAWYWLEKHKILEIIPKKRIFFIEKDKNFWCQKLKIEVYMDDTVKILDTLSSVPWKVFFNPFDVRG